MPSRSSPRPAPSFRRARSLTLGGLGALTAFVLTSNPGCGTSAKGIDDCRDIETARCDAASACGVVTDVPECQRYYRDHCLHGLAVEPPARDQVDRCVQTIQKAATCARTYGSGAALGECDENVTEVPRSLTACDVVLYPERTDECAFLSPTPVEDPDDNGEGGDGNEPEGGAGEGGSN